MTNVSGLICACLMTAVICCAQVPASNSRRITVNRQLLAGDQLGRFESLERAYRTVLPDGDYWYDNRSGAFGRWGKAAAALIPAGLALGGPMPENCSAGTMPVYINGRQLPVEEVQFLSSFVPVYPGRVWLNSNGDVGAEGGAYIGNLFQAAAAAQARSQINTNQNGGRAKYAMDGIYVGKGYYLER